MVKLPDIVKGGLPQIQANIDYGWISKRKHPQLDYWILNYTQKAQIDWEWNSVTTICRGLIVDQDWNIIARPFKKFFTLDQWQTLRNSVWNLYHVKYSEMFNGPFEIQNKIDGCLNSETIISTEDGPKTIKDICERKYIGKVLSYNIEEEKEEFDEIIGVSIKNNNNDWYEIELESGEIIKITSQHKVWLPKLKCYRKVEDLQENDEFLLKN